MARDVGSVWTVPGMPALAVLSVLGFTGYAALFPVVPLWVVAGGSGTAGAGLVNGVMLAATVATQGFIPMLLRRFGWATVLTVGLTLLGLPALAIGASPALPWVLAWSAVRGIGFGVLTVCGSSAVAELIEPARRGAGIGAYGLAIAAPSMLAMSAAPSLVETVGYWPVFVLAAAPVAGLPAGVRLAARIDEGQRRRPRVLREPDEHGEHAEPGRPPPLEPAGDGEKPGADTAAAEHGPGAAGRPPPRAGFARPPTSALLPLVAPTLILLLMTLAGGGFMTFLPQMLPSPALATAGLLAFGLTTAIGRWLIGGWADRYGAHRFTGPLMLIAVVGLAIVAWAVRAAARQTSTATLAALLLGALLTGFAYGAVQNLTLVLAFEAAGDGRINTASAVWNAGFDSGTAVGSVLVGVLATRMEFWSATVVLAALCAVALPVTRHQARASPTGAGAAPRGQP